ncbi:autophagy protein Apg5-domain-containing protein, partial [Blyttiomyces helicus]
LKDPDPDVTRAVWEGKVPMRITMDPGEAIALTSRAPAEAHFLLAPRCSYIPLLVQQVRQFFVDHAGLSFAGDDSEIWFESQGVPLKWHYPIGLLYDLHVAPVCSRSGEPPPLPWEVTVRFRGFPADKLIRVQSSMTVDAPQDHFMAMIKEADYLRSGSIKKVMSLSKQDQTALWSGISSNDYEGFWAVNTRLITTDGAPKSVPVRIYVVGRSVVQEPVAPFESSSPANTLSDALARLLPSLFQPSTPTASPPPSPLTLLHGVPAPLDAPLLWLSQNCAYPDNFLHI